MSNMVTFWEWWFQQLPTFLMSEPIKYFTGLCIFAFVVKIVLSFFSWDVRARK